MEEKKQTGQRSAAVNQGTKKDAVQKRATEKSTGARKHGEKRAYQSTDAGMKKSYKNKDTRTTDGRSDQKASKSKSEGFEKKSRQSEAKQRDFKALSAERRAQKATAGLKCPVAKSCGGCHYQGVPYEVQLKEKQKQVEQLLKPYCKVKGILGMKDPYYYRNKVHAVFNRKKDGTIVAGVYEANSHRVVPVENCLIEDQKAAAIVQSICVLAKSFKIKIYNEDSGYGLLRHVLIRTGYHSGQIMIVLVLASPIMPSKNNFVKALLKLHPEITTIVVNVNDKRTSMILGDKEKSIYGKGYIEDTLCGLTFRISPKSFYQVNPRQTEVLYEKAISLAGLTDKETVLDAYCGIGTIGMAAAKHAKSVIGVELNPEAVRDAVANAKANDMKNIRFYQNDAGKFMLQMAAEEKGNYPVDVVFMDPPRAGSDEAFLSSVVALGPKKVVYVSCNPETLARDLGYMTKKGYVARECWAIDNFPWTSHVESVVLMSRKDK